MVLFCAARNRVLHFQNDLISICSNAPPRSRIKPKLKLSEYIPPGKENHSLAGLGRVPRSPTCNFVCWPLKSAFLK
jgi:hypothetical protein